ncbi:hypothetical protein Mapa_009667 [Marchantia paleacea]|nr:hypothetical protein Mapa_009667 [Marchantia paleacea]
MPSSLSLSLSLLSLSSLAFPSLGLHSTLRFRRGRRPLKFVWRGTRRLQLLLRPFAVHDHGYGI